MSLFIGINACTRKPCGDSVQPPGAAGEALYRQGDFAVALGCWQSGCEQGDAKSCLGLGVLYAHGEGVQQDYLQAATIYQKGCDLGEMLACSNLGVLYMGRGLDPEPEQAKALFQKACSAGVQKACAKLGETLAGGSDAAMAFELLEKACSLDEYWACGRLGVRYLNGQGIASDRGRGLTLLRSACDNDVFDTCVELGKALSVADETGMANREAARVSLLKACAAGVSLGCQAAQALTAP